MNCGIRNLDFVGKGLAFCLEGTSFFHISVGISTRRSGEHWKKERKSHINKVINSAKLPCDLR
jgi:hypothetical protein